MSSEDPTANQRSALRRHAGIVILLVCVGAIYARLWDAPFLSWDDDRNISQNPYYLYLPWWQLWREAYFGLYVPVISTIWAAAFKLGGGDAVSFRLLNLALHLANTVLVWRLLTVWLERTGARVTEQQRLGIVMGAAVFALHPLQTATVAWISGGRDLSATFFALAAGLLYVRGERAARVGATLLFCLGLLCKPSIAAVPIAVVAVALVLRIGDIRRTAAWMGIWSAGVIAVAVFTSRVQSGMAQVNVPLHQRPFVMLDAAGFYLLKLVWPFGLNVDYGRTPSVVWANPRMVIPSLLAVIAACIALWGLRRHRTVIASALAWIILLSPVLGVTPFAFQRISTVADHYVYLPMVAVAALVGYGAQRVWYRPGAIPAAVAALLLLFAGASWNRLHAWQSDAAFFRAVHARNPESRMALTGLGQLSCAAGDYARGLELIERALTREPDDSPALANKAFCLFHAGQMRDVIDMEMVFRDSATVYSLERNDLAAASLMNSIAGAYAHTGQARSALIHLCQAAAIRPYDPNVRPNLDAIMAELRGKGMNPRCPPRLSWQDFSLVLANNPFR